jgi:hypothetical protein
MPDRNLRFVLSGVDQSASSTLGKAAQAGESASQKIGGAFTKLGGQIGGEFGEVLNKVGEGIESVGEHGLSLGKKLAIGGGVAAGVGVLLTAVGSKGKQATDQLSAAIDASGASFSDYREEVEKTVKHEENFAHSAVDTKSALRVLVQATGDTDVALKNMQIVTDLAAAKHISLADAAGMVAKILGGGGAKTLIQYGIHMQTNADGTKNVTGALDELGAKLQGQAAASMDNFGAKVDVVKTKLGDFVDEVGQKLGPVLTVGGTVVGALASSMEVLALRSERAAQEATNVGTSVAAAAEGAAGGAKFGPIGLALGAVGLAGFLGAKALGLFGKKAHEQVAPVQELTDAIKADSDAFGTNTKAQIVHTLSSKGLYDSALKLGISQSTLTSAVLGNAAAAKKVSDAINATVSSYQRGTGATKAQRDASQALANSLPNLQDQLDASRRAALNEASAMGTLSVKGQNAAQVVKTVGANINALKSKQIDITTYLHNVILPTVRGPSAGERHHASGGNLVEGWNIINEPNDEWLYKQGSQVTVSPHGTGGPTNLRSGGTGGNTYVLNVNAGAIVHQNDLGRYLSKVLADFTKSGGTLPIGSGIR